MFTCALGEDSSAQVFAPFERPGEERLELPEPAPPEEPEFTLPPLPAPPPGDLHLGQQPTILVREFRVTGSTVFSDAELAAITAPYTGHPIAAEHLERLRQELTLLYVEAGYLNSGALLPDQEVRDGVVEYRIVEGRVSEVEIADNRWFRDGYLRSRILRGAHEPLDVADLEQELQLLQQDPRIRRVDAALVPGERPGESRLRVSFEEELPVIASFESSNHDSPSVGQYRQQVDLANRNLTGWGDVLQVMGAWTEGLWDVEGGYWIPVTPWDTTIGAWYRWGKSEVVEQPFDELEIESRGRTIGIEVRQPVYQTVRNRVDLAVLGENRKSRTYLLDERFPFEEGTVDGSVVVSVLRVRLDWVYRDLHQVVAMRSQLSTGIDVLDATDDDCAYDLTGVCTTPAGISRNEIPDADFVAWLAQFQWMRRFDAWWGIETVFRTDLQLASEPVFSMEQFSLGGYATVRGYREHQLVRDNGFVSSLELRVPLWRDPARKFVLQFAPFGDIGRSWNTNREEAGLHTLSSAGVGLRAEFRNLRGEISWAHRFRSVEETEEGGLQNEGINFAVAVSF